MDGDGADDPARIPDLIGPIRAGTHDFVIGSRVRGEREPGSMAWHQIAAGQLAGPRVRALYGARYTDMCAFRAIRRERLLGLQHARDDLRVEHRNADAGRARRLRILEIPVPYRRRIGGASKVAGSLSGTLARGDAHRLDHCPDCDRDRADRSQPMRERDA